ncbi:MAG: hypothetical protein P8Y49_07700 [Sulfurovaceae bacterium]
MNIKIVHKLTVLMFLLIGITLVISIFIGSLSPSAREKAQIVKISLLDYEPGEVRLVRGDGLIYVIAYSDEMLRDLEKLSPHVWNAKVSTTYKSKNGRSFFIFNGRGTIDPGCLVKHYPKTQPNTYRGDNAVWYGGFLDPCRDVSYDYAGRLIKSISHSYINFTKEAPNMPQITYMREDEEGLHVLYVKR